ncbi:CNH domain-containing protein [Lentinula raphanica]|nr:CNH domain-containing protein [Lentinula raphanica]
MNGSSSSSAEGSSSGAGTFIPPPPPPHHSFTSTSPSYSQSSPSHTHSHSSPSYHSYPSDSYDYHPHSTPSSSELSRSTSTSSSSTATARGQGTSEETELDALFDTVWTGYGAGSLGGEIFGENEHNGYNGEGNGSTSPQPFSPSHPASQRSPQYSPPAPAPPPPPPAHMTHTTLGRANSTSSGSTTRGTPTTTRRPLPLPPPLQGSMNPMLGGLALGSAPVGGGGGGGGFSSPVSSRGGRELPVAPGAHGEGYRPQSLVGLGVGSFGEGGGGKSAGAMSMYGGGLGVGYDESGYGLSPGYASSEDPYGTTGGNWTPRGDRHLDGEDEEDDYPPSRSRSPSLLSPTTSSSSFVSRYINLSLLSHLSVQLKDKIPRGTHVKGGIPYPNAFTGKDVVSTIQGMIQRELAVGHGVSASDGEYGKGGRVRRLSLEVGREMQSQLWFCEVEWGGGVLEDGVEDVYMFLDDLGGGLGEGSSSSSLTSAGGITELPTGIVTALTKCYSPDCVEGVRCYSPRCPRKGDSVLGPLGVSNGGLGVDERGESSGSLGGDEKKRGGREEWRESVPAQLLRSLPESEVNRQTLIHKLISKEEEYVGDLDLIHAVFIKPLREMSVPIIKHSPSTDPLAAQHAFIDSVFSNILDLRETNKRLLEILRIRQREQDPVIQRVGDVFLEAATELFRVVYPVYVAGWARAERRLREEEEEEQPDGETKGNREWKTWVEDRCREAQSTSIRYDLKHYLTRPIDHLQKYTIFLTAILSETSPENTDGEFLTEALDALAQLHTAAQVRTFQEAMGRGTPGKWEWHDLVERERRERLSRRECKRQSVMFELIKGEMAYAMDLENIEVMYIRPLLDSLNSPNPIIYPRERLNSFISDVFHNFAQLHAHHARLVEVFHEIQRREFPVLSSVTAAVFDAALNFREAYMEYIPNYPIAAYRIDEEMGTNPAFKRFVEDAVRHPDAHRLDMKSFINRPIPRLLRYELLLKGILDETPEGHEDRLAIPQVLEVIKAIGKESEPGVVSAKGKVELWRYNGNIVFKPGEWIDMDLLDRNRSLIHTGRLLRQPDGGGLEWSGGGWSELFVLLFDNYLVMTKAREKDGVTKYFVNRRPIPLDLLTLVNFTDPPTQRGAGLLRNLRGGERHNTTTTMTESDSFEQNSNGLPPLSTSPSSSFPPLSTTTTNTSFAPSLTTSNSYTASSSSQPYTAGHPSSSSSSQPTDPSRTDPRSVFPFTLHHNGRQGGNYILFAESASARLEWKEKLEEAVGLRRVVQESNRVFEMETLSVDTFLVPAFGGLNGLGGGASGGGGGGAPGGGGGSGTSSSTNGGMGVGGGEHARGKLTGKNSGKSKGLGLGLLGGSSSSSNSGGGGLGPSYDHMFTGKVTCSVPFNTPDGRGLVAIGCAEGVWIGFRHDSRSMRRVLHLKMVTQCAMLEDFGIFLVLADKSLFAYHIEALVPSSPSSSHSSQTPQKLSGNKDVYFFSVGTLHGRTLVIYMKKKGLDSIFHVVEPVVERINDRGKATGGGPGHLSPFGSSHSAVTGGGGGGNLGSRFGFRQAKSDWFRAYREFFLPSESYDLIFLKVKIVILCAKGFEIMDLMDLQSVTIPQREDPQHAPLAKRWEACRPLGMFRSTDDEFLLCYTEFGLYVNKHGDPSRQTGSIEWEGTAERVALHPPYILLFDTRFIEVRHVQTGRLAQIIMGNDVRCLWDGRGGGGLGGLGGLGGGEGEEEHMIQEARVHAVMNASSADLNSIRAGSGQNPNGYGAYAGGGQTRAIAQHVFELIPTIPLYLPGSLASPSTVMYFPQSFSPPHSPTMGGAQGGF